jgi:hypothetical protein
MKSGEQIARVYVVRLVAASLNHKQRQSLRPTLSMADERRISVCSPQLWCETQVGAVTVLSIQGYNS